jgi:hypothetical protein
MMWRNFIDLQLAELPPPPIISHFAHANLADRADTFCPHSTYRRLRDDLFGLVALPCHLWSSLRSNTYLKSDHFQEVDQCGIRKDRQNIVNSDIRAQE